MALYDDFLENDPDVLAAAPSSTSSQVPEMGCLEVCMENGGSWEECQEQCFPEVDDPNDPNDPNEPDDDDGVLPLEEHEHVPITNPWEDDDEDGIGPDLPDDFTWDAAAPPPPPAPPGTEDSDYNLPEIPEIGGYDDFEVDALTGLPVFNDPEGDQLEVGDVQNFTDVTSELTGFEAPGDLDSAPDFSLITDELTGFDAPGDPDIAPGFEFTAGQYETPDDAFRGEELYGGLEQFSEDWLANPNRFLSPLAESTRATSEAELNKYEQDATRSIDERMSQRGLVGSSYEGEAQIDLQGELARARAGRETDILKMLADAETADKRSAAELGIQTGQFGAELGGARRSEAEIAQQLALDRGHLEITAQDQMDAAEEWRSQIALETEQTQSSQDRADTALELQAAGQEEQGILDRGRLDLQAAIEAANNETAIAGLQLSAAAMQESATQYRSDFAKSIEEFGFQAAFANAELEQKDALQRATLELDAVIAGDAAAIERVKQELDSIRVSEEAIMDREYLAQRDQELELRAYEIQTDAALRGEEIDTDRGRIMAELDWRREEQESRERIAGDTETGLRTRHQNWLNMLAQE